MRHLFIKHLHPDESKLVMKLKPDFVHYMHDLRAYQEIADGDELIFHDSIDPNRIAKWTFDDSHHYDGVHMDKVHKELNRNTP